MTPEDLSAISLKLIEGSDELEDTHAKILLQSIKTLAEKGLGRSSFK